MVDVVNREFSSSKVEIVVSYLINKYVFVMMHNYCLLFYYQDPFVSGLGQAVDKWVSSVTFGYNCIIITKMDEEEFGFAHRPYRYSENTTPVVK